MIIIHDCLLRFRWRKGTGPDGLYQQRSWGLSHRRPLAWARPCLSIGSATSTTTKSRSWSNQQLRSFMPGCTSLSLAFLPQDISSHCEQVHWRHPNQTFRDGHHRRPSEAG